MSLIVQKFGGSSVRDTEHLLRMAHIARERRAEGNDVVVVLSAQGDTTDTLLKKALELTPSPDGREMDALLASGEQVSAALGALALQTLGVDAVSLSAWQVPIETDGAHGDAQIEMIDTARIRRELDAAAKDCAAKAAALSAKRREAASELEGRISAELRELNMPSVRFAVEFSPLEGEPGFDANGCDDIRFIMSANAGEALGRINRIASGGELSRIMLAMKNVFAENDPVGTMIFDEIDTGVSGIAAQRVGEKLFSVSLGKQVMCVTHLPQIAAMADNHYLIRKEERGGRTYTDVLPLDLEGRKQELARMHGGDNITETTLASAEEQLRACEKFKQERIKHTA